MIEISELTDRVRGVVRALGAPAEVATEVADHLVRAELSGHASHGVLRLPQYAAEIERGLIVAGARAEVVSATPAAIVVDGHHGFGHHAAALATEEAAVAAERLGVAAATVRRSTHIGRLGEYAERLAARGLVALVQVGAAGPGVGSMAPFGSGSGRPFLNTNPWSVGVPAADGAIVFDGSMSTIAEGKVHAAKRTGDPLPEGAVLTADGLPGTDPEDFYADGTLTPLGGALAGHKGYGLALAAALLGGLAHADGSAASLRGLARLRGPDEDPAGLGGVTIIALDPGAFGERDAYAATTGRVAAALRADGVLVPGDLERCSRAEAGTSVALPPGTLAELAALETSLL
ncbi:Ldh family oxidoreductase [Saccharopolyspora sp. 6V]|uniref:Ldh family oxidoreductase n=1 Tax=Saccharopolyspora sp. 6V TaxID=2877239 RepID=UPI001CD2208F|nr:Ldh family oxidoreductase [Saccharopolyspora sp. 6V]MCA1192163.1 Ldh family oxidoreductase [Saccharopolyspora sp. 6V]